MKILVIEDDIIQNKALCLRLELMGYTTCSAHNGYAGLLLAISERPGLIIIDHGLPGLPGIDTFRELRKQRPTNTIPVIMVTCDLLMPDEVEVKSKGAFYIVKPLKPDHLAFCIKKALEPMIDTML